MGVELREIGDPRSDGGAPEPVETAVRPRSFHGRDAGVMAGAALSSFSLMYLVFFRLSPLSGLIGFLLAWYATFLCIYGLVVRELEGRRFARDKVMTVIIGTAGRGLPSETRIGSSLRAELLKVFRVNVLMVEYWSTPRWSKSYEGIHHG